jgi:tetratricopeptide (TPR) repeat protein
MVLHRIVESKGKGTLTLSQPSERINLFFVDGELKAANSTRAGMRIGETLLVHGVVPEEDFEEAIHSVQSGRRGRIGKFLVEKGLLTQEVLDAEIRRHFEEIFFSCFAWREGDFAFLPSRGRLDSDVSLDLPTAALIIEGVRRTPEEERCLDALGDLANFGRSTRLASRLESLRLSSEEAYFLSLCDGRTRLRDILRLGRSRSETAQTLYTLLACGLIEFAPPSAVAKPPAGVQFEDIPFLPPSDDPEETAETDPANRDERARIAYREARGWLEKGNYYRAIVLLQDCVRLFPENAEYRFRLAGALCRNELWRRRALVQYREALRLDPFRKELLRELAEVLLIDKKFRAAYEIAQRLAAHHPDDPRNDDLLRRCRTAALGRPDPGSEAGPYHDPGASIPSPRFRDEPR